MNQKQPSPKVSVEPQIRFDGDTKPHVMEDVFNSEKAPVIKSVGFMKLPSQKHYVSYLLTTQGGKIIKAEVGEPNLRAIAEDEAKINFVNSFIDSEFEDLQAQEKATR